MFDSTKKEQSHHSNWTRFNPQASCAPLPVTKRHQLFLVKKPHMLWNHKYLVIGNILSYDTARLPLLCFLKSIVEFGKNFVWLDERSNAKFSLSNLSFLEPCWGKTEEQNNGDILENQPPRSWSLMRKSPQLHKLEYIKRFFTANYPPCMSDILYMACDGSGPCVGGIPPDCLTVAFCIKSIKRYFFKESLVTWLR